jgi:hypothetical protein
MFRGAAVRVVLTVLALAGGATGASAQVFGTFSWQMQPYCNKVTLTLTSVTGNFTLDGSDDQCGAAQRAGANGIAVFNLDGSVGLNFTIVTAPGGRAVHVSAIVSPGNGQGTWSDDAGHSGAFAFFGNTSGLPARPSADAHFRTAGANQQLFGLNVALPVTSWNSAELDNVGGGLFDPASGSYTVRAPGVYALSTTLRLVVLVSSGFYCAHLYVNGVQRVSRCEEPPTIILGQLSISGTLRLAAGDVVSVRATNSTGSTGGVTAGIENVFSVTRLQ